MRAMKRREPSRRRGALLVLAAITMILLVVAAAFAVDIGYVALVRTELQRTADSCALAVAWEVFNDGEIALNQSDLEVAGLIVANEYSAMHNSTGGANTLAVSNGNAEDKDVEFGYWDKEAGEFVAGPNPNTGMGSLSFDAVKVRVRRDGTDNPHVSLIFGRLLGSDSSDVEASAIARVTQGGQGPGGFLLPYGLPLYAYNLMEQGLPVPVSGKGGVVESMPQQDNYTYDPNGPYDPDREYDYDPNVAPPVPGPWRDRITSGSDEAWEYRIFPSAPPPGETLPGNFGSIDIGSSGNSTAELMRQIVMGPDTSDYDHPDFTVDQTDPDSGMPYLDGNFDAGGDTGISGGVEDYFEHIIGRKAIIPLFATGSGTGNNVEWQLVGWGSMVITEARLPQPGIWVQVLPPEYRISRSAAIGPSDWENFTDDPNFREFSASLVQ